MATTISDKAYCKLMLHILKHTSIDCYGILIGTKPSDDSYSIKDAIPISHDKLYSPSIEIALKLIETYIESPLVIIGVYENLMQNQMKKEAIVSEPSNQLCELIHSKITQYPLLLEIYSLDITDDSGIINDEVNTKIMKYNGQGDFMFNGMYNETQSQFDSMKKYLTGCVQNDIVDFDDHLLEANADWRNLFIKE